MTSTNRLYDYMTTILPRLGGPSWEDHQGEHPGKHSPPRASRECISPPLQGAMGPWALTQPMVPMAPKGMYLVEEGSPSPSDPKGGPHLLIPENRGAAGSPGVHRPTALGPPRGGARWHPPILSFIASLLVLVSFTSKFTNILGLIGW